MRPIKRHIEREVRRVRHYSGWIKVDGHAHCECRVLDVSMNGAKIVPRVAVPDRFALSFSREGQSRSCEVVWRRARMLGVKFIP